MNYSPEVLMYINSVKEFLTKNEEAREYFLSGLNEDEFFDSLTEISQYNFNRNGDATLSKSQFEIVRVSLNAFKKIDDSIINNNSVFSYDSNDIKCYLK